MLPTMIISVQVLSRHYVVPAEWMSLNPLDAAYMVLPLALAFVTARGRRDTKLVASHATARRVGRCRKR